MGKEERFYPESKFGGFTDIDGTIAFYSRVNSLLQPSFVVLDLGCGRGSYREDKVQFRKNLRIMKGKVFKVIGIDVDKNARNNPFIDEFHLINGDKWPIVSDSIDLIICDYVLEHVCNPNIFFREIKRVLKQGGILCLRTPNRWSYFAIAATIIPNKYHSKITSFVQHKRDDDDVFPTVYKCNSFRKLRGILKDFGFSCVVYGYEAEPSYLHFSKIFYFIGVLYQRFAPGFLKTTIFSFGELKKV